MKYSFIIPVLNEEKLILNLLKQISDKELKKEYDFEIILSDGGSRDSTISLALPFADKIICPASNAAQNIAIGRNTGAEKAAGEVLVFLNGDIIFNNFPNFLKELDSNFFSKGYSAFTCNVKVFPDEETFSDKIFLGFYNSYFRFLNTIGIGMGRGECHAVTRNLFNKINGNNPKLAAGEDFELFTRIKRIGKVIYSNKVCVYESPRRYRKSGHLKIFFLWLANSASVIILGKSVSHSWEEVR